MVAEVKCTDYLLHVLYFYRISNCSTNWAGFATLLLTVVLTHTFSADYLVDSWAKKPQNQADLCWTFEEFHEKKVKEIAFGRMKRVRYISSTSSYRSKYSFTSLSNWLLPTGNSQERASSDELGSEACALASIARLEKDRRLNHKQCLPPSSFESHLCQRSLSYFHDSEAYEWLSGQCLQSSRVSLLACTARNSTCASRTHGTLSPISLPSVFPFIFPPIRRPWKPRRAHPKETFQSQSVHSKMALGFALVSPQLPSQLHCKHSSFLLTSNPSIA